MAGVLFIVRHGATSLNDAGDERLRGWSDVPLATPGLIAARHAGRALQPYAPTKLYTSDLQRAHDTARIMSVTLGLTPEVKRDLRPWDVGEMTGQPVADVLPTLQAYQDGKQNEPPPGSQESFIAFLSRAKTTLQRLLAEARQRGEPIVAVTHARFLYAVHHFLFGGEMPVKGPPDPGAVIALSGPQGRVMLTPIYNGPEETVGAMSG